MEKIFLYDVKKKTKLLIEGTEEVSIEEVELFAYEQQAEALKSNNYLWIIRIKPDFIIN